MAVFSTLVLLSQELLTLAALTWLRMRVCEHVCVCACLCVHTYIWQRVGSDGWQPRNLAVPCTNFKLPSFLSHYTYTYTFTHTLHMSLIAEAFQGSMVQIGCLPGGNPTPEAWVSAFATLPFIHQQLNFWLQSPICFFSSSIPLSLYFFITFIAILVGFQEGMEINTCWIHMFH